MTQDRIEVAIRISEYPQEWSLTPAMHECWIVGKLKDAGIPIDGALVFRGIKSGVLTRLDDPSDWDSCKYIWTAK